MIILRSNTNNWIIHINCLTAGTNALSDAGSLAIISILIKAQFWTITNLSSPRKPCGCKVKHWNIKVSIQWSVLFLKINSKIQFKDTCVLKIVLPPYFSVPAADMWLWYHHIYFVTRSLQFLFLSTPCSSWSLKFENNNVIFMTLYIKYTHTHFILILFIRESAPPNNRYGYSSIMTRL